MGRSGKNLYGCRRSADQYLVLDSEELKDAQIHPDDYRDLLVRVGGYSAVFVDLTKELQDSIIAREELSV